MAPTDAEIAAVLMDLARTRGPGKSLCPSEAARTLASDWRPELAKLEAAEVTRDQLPDWFGRILKGGVRGRVVVKVAD